MTQTARVCVVIPTCRRAELLERCLSALRTQTLPPQHVDIVVCDDGPDDATRAVVAAQQRLAPNGLHIQYLPVTETQGPAGARNRGWQWAQAPIIAFTDDDTIPDAQWLEQGLAAMVLGVDAVSGRVIVPLPDAPSDLELDAAGLADAEFVTANCFVRREVLHALGGFDERFTMAWREDSDLHFHLLEAGCVVTRAPAAQVVHPVRPMPFAAGLRMQKKVLFDVLLYAKHPQMYRRQIRRHPPWFYLWVSGLVVLGLLLLALGAWHAAAVVFTLWVLATLWFFIKRQRRVSMTARNAAELLLTSALIPPLSIFWRFVGIRRFAVRFP